MSARLHGYRGTVRALRKLPHDMREAANEVMHDWADDVEATAEDLVPVDTGYLQSAVTSFVKEDLQFARVGTFEPEAYYAQFVEFGTSDTPEQPFLRPAFDRHKRGVAKTFRNTVRRMFG